jgi:hypothetical protein
MTVTWTSGYDINEAYPFVEWGIKWSPPVRTAAGTVTFDRDSICGMAYMNILSSSTEKKWLLREKYKIIFLRYLLET